MLHTHSQAILKEDSKHVNNQSCRDYDTAYRERCLTHDVTDLVG